MKHKLQDTLQLATMAGVPILLTGEAGTGKSESVVMVAKELGYTLHSLSVGEQTTKTDILGFMDATGTYRSTGFRKAFEGGGVFLLDEIDAGNPNVLLAINSGISNGFIEFPDTVVHSHETFRLIATANTFGTGAGIKYVGRNKLDLATLNRFAVLHWTLDEELEAELCTDSQWLRVIHEARKLASDVDELMIGMRNTLQGVKLLDIGLPIETVFDMVITKGLDEDIAAILKPAIEKYTQETVRIGSQVVVTDPEHKLLGKTGYVSDIHMSGKYEIKVGATYGLIAEEYLWVIGSVEEVV